MTDCGDGESSTVGSSPQPAVDRPVAELIADIGAIREWLPRMCESPIPTPTRVVSKRCAPFSPACELRHDSHRGSSRGASRFMESYVPGPLRARRAYSQS